MVMNPISTNKISQSMALSENSVIDTETKNLMNQLTSKQQNLKRLSSDSEMSAEEKAKERQEIQKQIAELNRKLRMLRMERKEEAKELKKEEEHKAALKEEKKEETSKIEPQNGNSVEETKNQQEKINIMPQNIQKILEAGTIMQRERIWQSVEQEEKATQKILEAEMQMDKLYGTDTSIKKEKLYSLIEAGKKKVEIEEMPRKQNEKPQNNPVKIVFRDDEII